MSSKFLDLTGLTHFYEKMCDKVISLIGSNHMAITKSTDSTSSTSPSHGGSFTTIDSMARDDYGHVTNVNTKTVTLPAGYTHPSYTSRTSGLYKITVDSTGHVSAVTAVAKDDITGLGIPAQDTVYTHPSYSTTKNTSSATATHSGTVTMIDGITVDSTGHVTAYNTKTVTLPEQYTHPSYTSRSSGLYKVTVDSTGHVSAVTAVSKSDITALGIPESDTVYTHPTATQSNSTSTTAPAFGGTFTAIDSVTRDSYGHVTGVNTKTVTIPKAGDSITVTVGGSAIALSDILASALFPIAEGTGYLTLGNISEWVDAGKPTI